VRETCRGDILYKGCRRCLRGINLVLELCYGEGRLAALLGPELVFVTAGWVARLGHVRGWMFMFDVVVGGEPRSWVASAAPSRPYSIFYVSS
jgi:hypothetical protein